MTILKIFGWIIGFLFAYFIVIIFFPIMNVKKQPFKKNEIIGEKEVPRCREDIVFEACGEKISGWLYLPEKKPTAFPCVVLSHGFGGTKDLTLENYALKFAEKGYAALTYDYRHYGESRGEPRQLLSATKQLDDLRAAIEYARSREDIDDEKIVLWGTSAGASYGIVIAGEDEKIAGVVAQCGSFDNKEDSKLAFKREGIGFFLKLFIHAQRDKGRSRFGLSRHIIPAYGVPNSTAFLRTQGVFDGVQRLAVDSKYFINEVCARFMLMPHAPNLLIRAINVRCPVQLLVCEKDEIVSPKSHLKIEKVLGDKVEVKLYPIGHFDIYFDEDFEKAVKDQLAFIEGVCL
ncbi:MAG: alpha/beta hydrolase [Bacillota bacterium]|nr:alpha/beta hydrolase [Bacillota bacterium]